MTERILTTATERIRQWSAAAALAYRATPAGPTACRQGFVLTHDQARAAGLENRELRSLVRTGTWTAPRRGALCVLPRSGFGGRPEILATAAALVRPDAAVSHECAALAQGLEVLHTPALATLTCSHRLHAATKADAIVRAAAIDDDDITGWFGAPITRAARTVVDIARAGLRDGVVVADSALRNELVTPDELQAALERQRRWNGVVIARRVLELASPKSESPLESLTRAFLVENDIPLPEQQVWIETYRGWFRVDGLWEKQRVVLEVDGLEKYRRSPEARAEEKLREHALEVARFAVERVTWDDLYRFAAYTARRLRAAAT